MVQPRVWLMTGIALAGLAVGMGAFGAHWLKDRLAVNQRGETFETAARYQMYHALALIALGLWAERNARRRGIAAGVCFLLGTVIFSGSLYILALSNVTGWGAVAPIGGVFQLLGWGLWFFTAVTEKSTESS